jgi:hypothetical protein
VNSASAKSAQLLHHLNENAEIADKGESYMLDVCGQCGSVISKKLRNRAVVSDSRDRLSPPGTGLRWTQTIDPPFAGLVRRRDCVRKVA